jgi:hypothetical protein
MLKLASLSHYQRYLLHFNLLILCTYFGLTNLLHFTVVSW